MVYLPTQDFVGHFSFLKCYDLGPYGTLMEYSWKNTLQKVAPESLKKFIDSNHQKGNKINNVTSGEWFWPLSQFPHQTKLAVSLRLLFLLKLYKIYISIFYV